MNQELEKVKNYCITKGLEEHFFYSYYVRLLTTPLEQCKASKKYDFNPGGRNHWTPLYIILSCFIEKMPNHKKINEWKEALDFLENNKPKFLNQQK